MYIIFRFYLRESERKKDIAHCKRVPSVNSCLGEVAYNGLPTKQTGKWNC